jgi:hypothetical protein
MYLDIGVAAQEGYSHGADGAQIGSGWQKPPSWELPALDELAAVSFEEFLLAERSSYAYAPPSSADYIVNLIVDPCRGHRPDCCMGVFGSAEYNTPNFTRVEDTVSAFQVKDKFAQSVDVCPRALLRLPRATDALSPWLAGWLV